MHIVGKRLGKTGSTMHGCYTFHGVPKPEKSSSGASGENYNGEGEADYV